MSDRLLLDAMLGKLATYLRMCGYDAAYALDEGIEDPDTVLAWAREDDRRLVTRNASLAARTSGAVLLEAHDIEAQLAELAASGFALELPEEPARCGVCNELLERVGADEPTPDYAPDGTETSVWRCTDCGQHFWKGSHWEDVAETLADVS